MAEMSRRIAATMCFIFIVRFGIAEPITVSPDVDGHGVWMKALNAVAERAVDMESDFIVEIADGTYHLDAPITLTGRHSGANGHFVVFRAAEGAKPVISGGRRVSGWKADAAGRWSVASPLGVENTRTQLRQLFVNGVRAQRARGPFPEGAEHYGDMKTIDADAGFAVSNSALAQWRNPADIEIGFFNSWSHMTCRVESMTPGENGTTRIRMHQPTFMLISRKEGVQAKLPASIENAIELLDEPGEWYFDESGDTLHYIPRPGESIETVETIVPRIPVLLETKEDNDPRLRPNHIRFEGITFADSGPDEVLNNGLADMQANFAITESNIYERDGFLVNVHNEYRKSTGAIRLVDAQDIEFDGCTFTRMGGAGVDICGPSTAHGFGTSNTVIRNCEFVDISGSAIQIGDVNLSSHHPNVDHMIVRNNRVENCKVHQAGVEYEGSVGIFAGYTEGTVIEGNEIYDLPYSGISIGWGWGEEDAGGSTYPIPFIYEKPTPARNNRIANNHIHHVMQKRLDGGGVYTLGNMPGTIIEGNHIHDNPGWPGGIYLDEGSGFIEVRNNRVYNVPTPMNFNNRNQNRIDTCNVHDNEFAEVAK